MSKPQPKQAAQKTAERAPKPKASSEAPVQERAPLVEELGRQGQAAGLPKHPTSSRLRQASILRMQRRQGNGAVQRFLRRRTATPAVNGRNGHNGSNGHHLDESLQRQVEEEGPGEEQKAAAQSAAQAAEGAAGQAATQAQQETGKSQAAGTQEQQNAGATQALNAENQSQDPGPGGPLNQNGPGIGPPEAGEQSNQAPSGSESATQAGGGASGGGSSEHAPTTPEEDEGFLSIVEQIRQMAGQEKSHPEAEQKAQEAQGAAESPSSETESKAKAGHVGEMESAEEPAVDKAGLKSQLMQKIQAVAPRTAGEADQIKSSNRLGGLKAEIKGKMEAEKSKSTGPMKEKSDAAPSQAGIAPKPVRPLPPPTPISPLQQFNAAPAVPKPKPKTEVEKPLKEESKSLDQQMAEAEITEDQLKKSNEPEFQSALDAKKEAQQHAEEAPQNYRQGEQEQISQAREEATTSTNDELQGMQDAGQQAEGQVTEQQGQAKSADEQKRQEIADTINGIYERTKGNVDRILGGLDGKVNPIFDAGAAAAQAAFEGFVAAKMEAYKQRRYGGMLGWARWAQDKLLGMPAEVNAFYAQGRERYLAQMDAVIDSVIAIISSTIGEAKNEVNQGKTEIQEYVNQLPAELQQIGQEAQAEIQGRFDELEGSIEQAQQELINELAQRYQENLQAIDARIEEMRIQHQGLLQTAFDRISGVIDTIRGLTERLTSILARVASAVSDIMRDPVGFLGNLLGAVRTGLTNFVSNIATHLQRGLFGWLFRALSDAGIEMPDSFDVQGILSLAMRVLGATWENIRARAVGLFGERVVGVLENVFDVFRTLKSEGLGGLFRFVQDKATGIKETIFDAVREMVTNEVVQAGIQKIMGLLGGPAGAFIKAVETIYDVISWFIGNAQQIGSLVQAIMSSVTAIVSGSISQVAGLIEQSLARTIPVVISFLANLLGLGDIGSKIIEIIRRVQAPVNNVVEWILNKAVRFARGIGGLFGGGESAGESAGGAESE